MQGLFMPGLFTKALFMKSLRSVSSALFLGAFACSSVLAAETDTSVLITNALIVDGSGAEAYSGSVRISSGRISDVGTLSPNEGETIVNAKGLALAPGFIDTHSHHDRGLSESRDALPMLTQGITTSVFGQDGDYEYPLASFVGAYRDNPAAINVASYVGHNTIRSKIMGDAEKNPATPAQIAAMEELLQSELESGALGLSTGLEYEPGIYSETSEVIALAQLTADAGGRYISHIRSEDRWLWESVDEIIEIGRVTGMPVQVSHMKLAAKGLWGDGEKLIEKLEAARAEGIDVTADVYPYEYWASTMWVLLPDRDPDNLEEIAFVLEELTPADGIIFTDFKPNPEYVGMSVQDISALRGTNDIKTFSDLLKEADAWEAEHPGEYAESIMGRSMHEDDIATFLAWEHSNICSDGGYTGHPRGHGAFPRVLGRYVRERNVLSLEKAVEAMTSRAAKHMGITNRGLIEPGYQADLVLFDPDTITDTATLENGQSQSVGVQAVWVNGVAVYRDGRSTSARPGMVITP